MSRQATKACGNRYYDCLLYTSIIPVDWNHKIPFGLLYSQTPSETVKDFVMTVSKVFCLEK